MDLRSLTPLLQEKARKEINEEPNRIASDIIAIKEWLEKQPHLKSVNPSDQWLVAFLRGNEYSIEKTKSKLDMYYTLRTVIPEIFGNRNPFDPTVQAILKSGIFLPLTTLEAEGSCRICLQPLGAFDAANYTLYDLLKVIFMIFEILILEDDNFIISGTDIIIDLNGVGLSLLGQLSPAIAKKSITIVEKALPIRVRYNLVLKPPIGFEAAFTLFRAFSSDKLKNTFKVYGQNFESIYEMIPQSVLPKEYGGERGTVQELTDYWKNKVESYSDWYLREEKMHSDEALRPGPPKTTSDLFGVEGSFRKLALD